MNTPLIRPATTALRISQSKRKSIKISEHRISAPNPLIRSMRTESSAAVFRWPFADEPHDFNGVAANRAYKKSVEEQAHETQAKHLPCGKPDSKNSKEYSPPNNPEQVAHAGDQKPGRQPCRMCRSQDLPGPHAKILLPKNPCQQRDADERLNKERNPFFHAIQHLEAKGPARSTEATEGNQDPSSLPGHEGQVGRNFWAISALFSTEFSVRVLPCPLREPNPRLLWQSTLLLGPFHGKRAGDT